MNEFDKKCLMLCSTPQERWFDLRLNAIFHLIKEMETKGLIKTQIINDYLSFGISITCFKYEGKWYFLFIEKHTDFTGTIINDCFQIENYYTLPGYPGIKKTDIVATSDDDNWGPNKTTNNRYLPILTSDDNFKKKFPL